MRKSIAEQWRAILLKAFNRWHRKELERIDKILNDKK